MSTVTERPEPRVRTRLPIARRFRLYFTRGDQVAELEGLWIGAGHWRRLPEADDPTWIALGFGPFVLAFRLTW